MGTGYSAGSKERLSVMTNLILVALGIVLVVLMVMIFKRKEAGPPPIPQRDLASLRVTDARMGDSISVLAAGDDFEDLDFVVDRKNRYESGNEEWFELSGMYKGRRVFVEYYEDDEVEVSVNLGREKPLLSDLGLTENDLIRMDEERSTSNGFEYDGQPWRYVSSQEVGYFKDGRGDGEGYYCWDFRSEDGKREIFVEKWEGEPFEGGIAGIVNPNDVKVYRPS
jgi:hypothetical protein